MKRVQSIILSSSIINTSVFLQGIHQQYHFLMYFCQICLFKKLWIVVPFIRDAATPLGASLVIAKLHCLRYSTMAPITNDLPHPAVPITATSICELFHSTEYLTNQKLFVGML